MSDEITGSVKEVLKEKLSDFAWAEMANYNQREKDEKRTVARTYRLASHRPSPGPTVIGKLKKEKHSQK